MRSTATRDGDGVVEYTCHARATISGGESSRSNNAARAARDGITWRQPEPGHRGRVVGAAVVGGRRRVGHGLIVPHQPMGRRVTLPGVVDTPETAAVPPGRPRWSEWAFGPAPTAAVPGRTVARR